MIIIIYDGSDDDINFDNGGCGNEDYMMMNNCSMIW